MAGDTETASMVMQMEEGLDTGPIAMAERVAIGPDMTAGELHDRLARLGADLMVRALGALERGSLQLTPQPEEGVTYAAKIDKHETRIDWAKPWQAVHDHCRGLSPFPGAWFELPGAGRIKVLRTTSGEGSGVPGTVLDAHLTIACGDGAVRILELQRAGGRPMRAEEFLRGTAIGCRHAAPVMPRFKLTIEYDGAPFRGLAGAGQRHVGAGRADRRGGGVLRRGRACAGRRAHRCRRACARPGRPCRTRQGLGHRHRARCAQLRICGRTRSRCCGRSAGGR